jgi:hypothetical protein
LCTKEEVRIEIRNALEKNSIERDRNLDRKLQTLKLEIDASINSRINHLETAPGTTQKFNKIDILCAQRGEQIITMKDDIAEIKENVKNILSKIDSGLDKKADKETFIFWRNLLVSGMFLAIFLGVVGLVINKLLTNG